MLDSTPGGKDFTKIIGTFGGLGSKLGAYDELGCAREDSNSWPVRFRWEGTRLGMAGKFSFTAGKHTSDNSAGPLDRRDTLYKLNERPPTAVSSALGLNPWTLKNVIEL